METKQRKKERNPVLPFTNGGQRGRSEGLNLEEEEAWGERCFIALSH